MREPLVDRQPFACRLFAPPLDAERLVMPPGHDKRTAHNGVTRDPPGDIGLERMLSCLLEPSFRFASGLIEPSEARLFLDERAYIKNATPRRQAEFGTARVLARNALAQLGFPPQSLVPHLDRSPRWPVGAVGSIAHSSVYCAVAVGRTVEIGGVGLDVEDLLPLGQNLTPLVCTAGEQAWLSRRPPEQRGRLAKLFFSAKEAVYKCQYGLTGGFLEHHDVELALDLERGRFNVVLLPPRCPIRRRAIRGRFGMTSDAVVTVATISADHAMALGHPTGWP